VERFLNLFMERLSARARASGELGDERHE
jgi:hypothetical protein